MLACGLQVTNSGERVARRQQRPRPKAQLALQAPRDSGLAVADDFAVGSTHLKCPFLLACVFLLTHTLTNGIGHFYFLIRFLPVAVRLYEV